MSQKTVKTPTVGTGAVRSVTGNVFDFLNNLGGAAQNLATKYVDFKAYKNSRAYTSEEQPIASPVEDTKLVDPGTSTAGQVSTNQLLMVGGGIIVGGLVLYTLLRKKK